MTLPTAIIEIFEKETADLKFGRVSVGLVMRGGHCHFEVEKHYTVFVSEKQENKKINGRENGQSI